MKTLIVEDDMMSQCLLAKVLAERGHEVTSFDNAEQAILAYQQESYPLLLVDVDLPGMDGLQFCKWVRAQPDGEKVFIMVATSTGQPEDMEEVLGVGANDFLVKPYDVGTLAVRLTIAEWEMRDFFQRKQLEDALRGSQEGCNRVFKAANEGVWLLNARFQTDYVNPQMAAMIGYPAEELLDRAVIDFLPETAQRDAEQLFAQQSEGRDVKKEIRFRRQDGSECLALLSATPVRNDSGEFTGSLWMVADLTGRKNLETELAETREKLEAEARDLSGELDKSRQSWETEFTERRKLEQAIQQQTDELTKSASDFKIEQAARKQVEETLQRVQPDLEERVRELTAQVARAGDDLRKEQGERNRAEQELAGARNEIAHRLKEHPLELLAANQELKAERAERKRAEAELLTARDDVARRVKDHMAEMIKAADELNSVLAERKQLEQSQGRVRDEAESKVNERTNELAGVREQLKAAAAERQKLESDLARTDAALTERTVQTARMQGELEARNGLLDTASAELLSEAAAHRRAEARNAAFLKLGRELSTVRLPIDVARAVAGVAHESLGWDACSFGLYSPEENRIHPVLNIDTVNGRPADVPPVYSGPEPGPIMQRVVKDGPQLILRSAASESNTDYVMFGDRARLSASLMYVGVRAGNRIVALLSVQSYAPGAYTEEDLNTLQTLADLCGGALERIRAEEIQRLNEARFHSVARATHDIVPPIEGQPRLAAILEAALDAIVTIDHEGKVSEWNPAAEKMFGYRRAEVLGRDLAELIIPPSLRDEHRSGMDHAFTQREGGGAVVGRRVELKAVRADGTVFPIEMTVVRLAGEGPPTFTGFIRDITDRLGREAQTRHAERMDSIGQLAGGVAHDFNNLLGVVQGYSTLLLEEKDMKPEMEAMLRQIASATERACHLTGQLLAFSRKQTIHVRTTDLNELINNVVKLLRRVSGENIALQFNYPPTLPPVEVDTSMIEQAVMNLAIHARDAMPAGGQLSIATKVIEIEDAYVQHHSEARAGRFVCLSVTDTGGGMDEAARERIFEPFIGAKNSGKGTGLGLAAVYGIVKQHEGWIEVQSRVAQGTTFQIFLPASSKTIAPPAAREINPAVRGGTETILLVEDEPVVLAMAKGILQRLGYQVITAPSGDDALLVWQQNVPKVDLLLTDMVMPGSLNGRELAERLLQEKPALKVLYTSGYSVELLGPGLATSKNFVFLQKPYHPEMLAQTVRNCLEGKRSD